MGVIIRMKLWYCKCGHTHTSDNHCKLSYCKICLNSMKCVDEEENATERLYLDYTKEWARGDKDIICFEEKDIGDWYMKYSMYFKTKTNKYLSSVLNALLVVIGKRKRRVDRVEDTRACFEWLDDEELADICSGLSNELKRRRKKKN